MDELRTVVHMEYGSKLYQTSTPKSDTDYASVYLPTFEEILLQKVGKGSHNSTGKEHQKNTKDDVDRIKYPLPAFLELCLAGDTTAIDMLHCDKPLVSSAIWDELVANRDKFYCKNMKAYVGYVKSQAMKYGIKGDRLAELKNVIDVLEGISVNIWKQPLSYIWNLLPEGEFLEKIEKENEPNLYMVLNKKYQDNVTVGYLHERLMGVWEGYGHRAKSAYANDGVDWKAIHHSLRVLYQTEAIFTKGDFSYPLDQTEFLLRVKNGEADYGTEIAPEYDRFFDNYNEMVDNSNLPKRPDRAYWEKWLLDTYRLYYPIGESL